MRKNNKTSTKPNDCTSVTDLRVAREATLVDVEEPALGQESARPLNVVRLGAHSARTGAAGVQMRLVLLQQGRWESLSSSHRSLPWRRARDGQWFVMRAGAAVE